MANLGKIIGGFAEGVGDAMIHEGKSRAAFQRDKKLLELRQNFQAGESKKTRDHASGENVLSRGQRDRLQKNGFKHAETMADISFTNAILGKKYDQDFQSRENDLNRKNRIDVKKSGLKAKDMSARDSRIWNAAVERHTTKGINGEETKWPEVYKDLKARSHPWAEQAAPTKAEKAIDPKSPAFRSANKQAKEEADDKASLWNSDSTDFKESDGNRSRWIENRTMEIYRDRAGDGKGPGKTKAKKTADKPAPAPKKTPAPSEKSTSTKKGKKPVDYPGARWSDRANGWVVKKGEKYYKVK